MMASKGAPVDELQSDQSMLSGMRPAGALMLPEPAQVGVIQNLQFVTHRGGRSLPLARLLTQIRHLTPR